jgi:DNA-directed RNA polymerase specialized sigma24 family protein
MPGRDALDFQQLFEPLYRQCHALARRLTGNDAQAEFVATEALARAYARWGHVRSLGHPEGWVLRMTVELAAEELARDDRAADELTLATTRLPARLRDAVALCYLTALEEDEVGLVLGMTPEAVHAAVQEGVVQLRNRPMGANVGV